MAWRRKWGKRIQKESVRDIFLEYLRSKRRFFAVTEACSIKGWPDRRHAIANALKLQVLYNEREELRFLYLIETGGLEDASCVSVSSISKRLLQNWRDVDEKVLTENNSRYKEIARQVADCQAEFEEDAVRDPLDAARQDPEYASALLEVQRKIEELDDKLTKARAS